MAEARIIPWAEAEQGDQALFDGRMVTVDAVQRAESTGALGGTCQVTRVAWRREDGTVFVGDFDPDQLTAVIRPGLTETEWGVRSSSDAGATAYRDEAAARYMAEPGDLEVVRREVTAWTPAPGKEESNA